MSITPETDASLASTETLTVNIVRTGWASRIAFAAFGLSALIGTAGLIAYARDQQHDATVAAAQAAAARAEVNYLAIESRCRADLAADVQLAMGRLFSEAFDTGFGPAARTQLADARAALSAALTAQQNAKTTCRR